MNTNAEPPIDSKAQAELFHQWQWEASQRLLPIVTALCQQIRTDPRPPKRIYRQAEQLLEVALKLGRHAVDPKNLPERTGSPPLSPEFQAAFDAIYGPSNPATDHLDPHDYLPQFKKPAPASDPSAQSPDTKAP